MVHCRDAMNNAVVWGYVMHRGYSVAMCMPELPLEKVVPYWVLVAATTEGCGDSEYTGNENVSV